MTLEGTTEVTHESPAWRERANFIIGTTIDTSGLDTPIHSEQLWARQLGENTFEVCCIPFFAYNLALGDVVETGSEGPRKYMITRVLRHSGRYTFRAWFHDAAAKEEVPAKLQAMGCLLEARWPQGNLLAIDAESQPLAQRVADFLWEGQKRGVLDYETGRTK